MYKNLVCTDFYDFRQVLGTRVPNLKSIALFVFQQCLQNQKNSMVATLCGCEIFSKTLLWRPTGTRNSRTKFKVYSSFSSSCRVVSDRQTEWQTVQRSKTTFSESAPSKMCRKHKISISDFRPHCNTFITLYFILGNWK